MNCGPSTHPEELLLDGSQICGKKYLRALRVLMVKAMAKLPAANDDGSPDDIEANNGKGRRSRRAQNGA